MKKEIRLGSIYTFTCLGNNKIYVGSTIRSPRQRMQEHLHYLRHNKHKSKYMQHSYNKYGEDSLVFEVVKDKIDPLFLLAIEQFYIWRHEANIMNSAPVSDSHMAAVAVRLTKGQSKAEKEKRKKTLQKTLDAGLSGTQGKWSDERKAQHSIYLTGRKMPKMKESTKKKISDFHMGRECPPEAIRKSVATRTAFIEKELPDWIKMRANGLSYRKIERLTGRCRRVIAREVNNESNGEVSRPLLQA